MVRRAYSIRFKFFGLIAGGFVAVAIGVVLLANNRMRVTIDRSQRIIHEQKLEIIVRELEQTAKRLQLTGRIEAYEESFRLSIVKKLRQMYFVSDDARIYPFIIDANGAWVMHPLFAQGDTSLSRRPDIQKMLSVQDGDFDYEYESGQRKWCVLKSFKEWGWIVAYAIPHEIKYADLSVLLNMLVAAITGTSGIVLLLLFVVISQMLRPITRLTYASKAIAAGHLDQQIEIESRDELGVLAGSFVQMRDAIKEHIAQLNDEIAERKRMEQERLAHLKTLKNMDDVNRAIQENSDLGQMMSDVLGVALSAFGCDRAYLLYPCVPDSDIWTVPMERSKPEYAGVLELGLEMPMTEEVATTARLLEEADGPVTFGPDGDNPLPKEMAERFGFHCSMAMALYPKTGKAWQFGIHQCTRARQWTDDQKRFFKEIGRRLEDALSSLLMYQNLQESEERYRMVFENSPVSIWEEDFSAVKTLFDDLKKKGVTDIETHLERHPETVQRYAESVKIVDVNRAALVLHGAASKEDLLAGLVHTFTPESFDTFRRELVSLWNEGTEMTVDAVVRTLTGDCRNVTVYFSVCPGYEETLSKVLVSLIDITKRKQTEEELAEYREHLEELIKDRTAELVEARDRAEAASRAKTAFLSNMSHELRTPLNAVIGYAQVLRMRHDDDSALSDALGIIQQSGDHLLTLINDILDISVIEAGRIKLSASTVHFATFLEGIANVIRLRAEAKHLAFEVETPDTLPLWVSTDETRLRQILLNLLGNAVKFTQAGRVVLRLERRDSPATASAAHPSHQALLRFEVSDTGIGIEKDDLDRIFQPFEQTHQVNQEAGGTGLGLAISRQLVQLMGGQLHVESEPGRGSVFWFEAALAVTGPAGDVMAPTERRITGYSGPPLRVLIADDITSNRVVLVEMLSMVGFETIEAMNGQQAVHLAGEFRPDLILMDQRMPGSNGLQAALQIRQIAGLEKVIIIAVTANVSDRCEAMCRRLGINAFLPKPVYWPRLAALLEKHAKIEWTYARNVQAQKAEKSADLVPPSPEELKILYEMARRGNLRAICERASRLETMDERLGPFVRRLRQLAQAFEDRAVLALIEQFIEE
jgi:PAS domain S-box-containing protein